jgi:transposase
MQVAVLGIDLGKKTCSLVGLDNAGHVVLRRRLQRGATATLVMGVNYPGMTLKR